MAPEDFSQIQPPSFDATPAASPNPRSVQIVIHEAAELAEQLASALRSADVSSGNNSDPGADELLDDLERLFKLHRRSLAQDVASICQSWKARVLSARGLSPDSPRGILLQDLADAVQAVVRKQQEQRATAHPGIRAVGMLRQQIRETWQTDACPEAECEKQAEAGSGEPILQAPPPRDPEDSLQSAACVELLASLEELVSSRRPVRAEFKQEVARVCQQWKDGHAAQSLPDRAGTALLLNSLSDLLCTAVSGDSGGREERGCRACSNLLKALKKLFSDGLERPGRSLASEISHVCKNWQIRERISADSESAFLVTCIADALRAEARLEASNTLAAMSLSTEELPSKERGTMLRLDQQTSWILLIRARYEIGKVCLLLVVEGWNGDCTMIIA